MFACVFVDAVHVCVRVSGCGACARVRACMLVRFVLRVNCVVLVLISSFQMASNSSTGEILHRTTERYRSFGETIERHRHSTSGKEKVFMMNICACMAWCSVCACLFTCFFYVCLLVYLYRSSTLLSTQHLFVIFIY